MTEFPLWREFGFSPSAPGSFDMSTASTAPPHFICKAFADLTVHELQALHILRQQVFVVEQNCVYRDADDTDCISWHLFALDEKGNALATCRLIPAGHKYVEAAIGRLANAQTVRGSGMGRAIMQAAIAELNQRSPGPIRISAQQYLQKFYESLGFEVVSQPYLEDDIPHLEMLRS